MDFPDYLSADFRLLEKYGALARKKHGTGTKRNIRFDDSSSSLYMDIKLPSEDQWMRVEPRMAREIMAEEDERRGKETRRKLTASVQRAARGLQDSPELTVTRAGNALLQSQPLMIGSQSQGREATPLSEIEDAW
jgi:hypothetical protein